LWNTTKFFKLKKQIIEIKKSYKHPIKDLKYGYISRFEKDLVEKKQPSKTTTITTIKIIIPKFLSIS
jgi:hypothetical protein